LISPLTEVAGEFRRVAAYAAPLRRHRVITHLTVTATALAVAVGMAIPTAPVIQAGLQTTPREGSILPTSLGIGVAGTAPVVLIFPGPMDKAAVAAGLGLAPATDVSLLWNADGTSVSLLPSERWIVDERYVVHIPAGTAMADGGVLATDWRASFTTQVAPHVVRMNVEGVAGAPTEVTPIVVQDLMASTGYPDSATSAVTDDATPDASSGAEVGLTFNAAMSHAATEAAFRISPAIAGTFRWEGTTVWFVPDQRFVAGTRYSISVVGARDADGNPLGGDTTFSFTTRPHAIAKTVAPAGGANGVSIKTSVIIDFSLPMNTVRTGSAFSLLDGATGRGVVGAVSWSADGRTMTFTPTARLGAGRTFTAAVGSGGRDADGNPVTASWQFTTAGPVLYASPVPVPVAVSAGSSSMVQYALNQINAARASYGFAPLVVDPAITAVAYAHAADMLANNYFSHTSLNGMTYRQRLTAGGVSYGYSGENICYLGYGGGVQATLDWCHAQFWAEPYPGGGNHKDNILSPNYHRLGVGIATGGNMVYVVWDFTD
jgi:uncharacterized protein YkwD